MSMVTGNHPDRVFEPLPEQQPAPAPTTALPAPGTLPSGDWELLLAAVQDRLLRATHACEDCADGAPACAHNGQPVMLECAAALGQLHAMFALELARHGHLELEVFDARTALAQARAELRGTQAGERLARYHALHDGLTALANRSGFMDQLILALEAAPRQAIAVMYLDLDRFKPINDLHGHAVGDEMLRIVAVRLGRVVRAQDVVGRLGGDEFACLLRGLSDRARLEHLANDMFQVLSAPCKIGPLTLAVRPSIGIACCPADCDAAQGLLNNADAAMYRAKRAGGGHAFFSA